MLSFPQDHVARNLSVARFARFKANVVGLERSQVERLTDAVFAI